MSNNDEHCIICGKSGEYHQILNETRWNNFNPQKCESDIFTGETCQKTPIRSHTIGRGTFLSRLADSDNQVLALKQTHEGHILSKQSIRRASIFNGFCEDHDPSLFKEIDIDQEIPLDEHFDQLHLRSLAFSSHYASAFIRRGESLMNKKLCDNCMRSIDGQKDFIENTKHRLEQEVIFVSAQIGPDQIERKYIDLEYVSFSCSYSTILGSSAFVPFEMKGNFVISINVILIENATRVYLIASSNESSKEFFENFEKLNSDEQKKLVSELVIQYCHNMFFCTDINQSTKESIIDAFEVRQQSSVSGMNFWELLNGS